MGNQYAPFYAAMLYLKGDDKLRADPRRALNLLQLSANRGNEWAYLQLAHAYRDGAFSSGKPDLAKAYFNAYIAEHWGADKADEVKAAIAGKLDPATREDMEKQAELYIEQNGK
jgi:TPR repeat protein